MILIVHVNTMHSTNSGGIAIGSCDGFVNFVSCRDPTNYKAWLKRPQGLKFDPLPLIL